MVQINERQVMRGGSQQCTYRLFNNINEVRVIGVTFRHEEEALPPHVTNRTEQHQQHRNAPPT